MIAKQEQLYCDELRDLFSSWSQPSLPVAAFPEMASLPADLVPAMDSRVHDAGRGSEELAARLLECGREARSETKVSHDEAEIQGVDLRSCMESWPYDPARNVRIGCGSDGRQIILVRQPMGLQQFEMDEFVGSLTESVRDLLSQPPVVQAPGDSGFLRQGDFWTIRYHGQSAFLKSNKGLECLACLLRSPGSEHHVSELVACHSEGKTSSPRPSPIPRNGLEGDGGQLVMTGLHGGTPMLDSQAKAECKRRLDDLREQEDEAERFNDPDRAANARAEINTIAKYLATATGLGGRDRKISSEAERARCAVTKRIKQAIQKIAGAIPDLGLHLTARIKTGYFCSYKPHPDRPVAWEF